MFNYRPLPSRYLCGRHWDRTYDDRFDHVSSQRNVVNDEWWTMNARCELCGSFTIRGGGPAGKVPNTCIWSKRWSSSRRAGHLVWKCFSCVPLANSSKGGRSTSPACGLPWSAAILFDAHSKTKGTPTLCMARLRKLATWFETMTVFDPKWLHPKKQYFDRIQDLASWPDP